MAFSVAPFTTLLFAALLLVGCGGESESGKSSSGGGGSGGSATGGSGGTTGGGGGTTGGGGGTTGGGGGTTGGTGGSATGGSAGTASGGAAGTGGNGVDCGNTTCGAGQYCCHPNCVDNATSCSGFALHCDGASDCPGGSCCMSPQSAGFPIVQCAPTCSGSNELVVCVHGVPNSCPSGMTCNITQQLPVEYGFCN